MCEAGRILHHLRNGIENPRNTILFVGYCAEQTLGWKIRDRWEKVRIFVGYAGWSPGQLEEELSEGAWFLLDAEPADAFVEDPTNLWRSVMARQGEPLRRLRHYPDDPDLN